MGDSNCTAEVGSMRKCVDSMEDLDSVAKAYKAKTLQINQSITQIKKERNVCKLV